MQDLFSKFLWHNTELDEAANHLRQTFPGFQEEQQAYEELAEQVRDIIGCDLYESYFTQLMRYSLYEVYAYYALGLGLRQEIVQTLVL